MAQTFRWPTTGNLGHSVRWESLTPEQRVYSADVHGVHYDKASEAWDRGVVAANQHGGIQGYGSPGNIAASNAAAAFVGVPAQQQTPAAPAAPAAQAAPAQPEPPPTPRVFVPDSIYNDKVGLANRNFTDTNAALDTDESRTKYDYGFDDTSNPFARAQESKRRYLMAGAGITNSLASRGQLFSGLHQSLLDENTRSSDKDLASLRAAYAAELDRIKRQRTGATTTRDEATLGAYTDAMQRQGVTS
jgi:hypothetical protein